MLWTMKWRGPTAAAVLLTLAAALNPLPAAAADTRPAAKPPKATTIKASVEKISAGDFAQPGAPNRSAVRAQSTSGMADKSFFKSKPGIIALAVLGAGVGYALYSVQNDRITSPAKQ